jgi:NSS family neurotransmitter:Na+ symporter
MSQKDFFSSRWGLILSALGIAVGSGNIWRFSRIVAQNGGGSFLIPWLVFLIIWSVPLIIAEFAIGKYSRLSPMGSFAKVAGPRFTWMGAFVAAVATFIMFYYSVITGWCLKYFISAASGELLLTSNYTLYWTDFSEGYLPLLYHFIVMIIAGSVIFFGVRGIEKISKILVTSLIIILLLLMIRAVTLPNALVGLEFFFKPDFNLMLDPKIWLNALTQNAWDTGAGWGLIMTYAIYMKRNEDISLNAALIGFGNNSISLIAGITIFSTAFALGGGNPISQISTSGPANTGLTFIFLPELFNKITPFHFVNNIFISLFFLALFFAAITSLISMLELSVKSLCDLGVLRKKSILIMLGIGVIAGIPSALNTNIFLNQDWVWGIGLIISGAFIAFAVKKFGVEKFRSELINRNGNDFKLNKLYDYLIKYVIPFEAIVLILWWLYSSTQWDSQWWNPFHTENLGTCILQWTIIISAFIFLNNRINKLLQERKI